MRHHLTLLLACCAFPGFLACDGVSYSNRSGTNTNNVNNANNTNNVNNTNNQTDPDVDDDLDGYTENQGDCNDRNPDVRPGVPEVCDDGIDNNCNGARDGAEPDLDLDGYGPCGGDCDDQNPEVNPSRPELPDDGVDNNCDGITDADFDGDGWTVEAGDCDDANAAVHPGVPEDCFDGLDNDCNGYTDSAEPDFDGDGAGPCNGDCAENNLAIGPYATEIPGDGIDNNCDWLIDADLDEDGWTVENGDCDDLNAARNPAILETCGDGVDNDCDGTVDTDCLTPCQLAELTRSSVGCVYYALDLDNYPGFDDMQYAVGISNTHATIAANVQIQTRSGGVWNTIETRSVPPRTLAQFNLPDRHVDNTNLLGAGAYKVVSDLPVIAYQFQPVDGVTSYTSDASLLLPTSSLDRYYYVLNWGVGHGRGQLNIVPARDNTSVTITPTVNTSSGGSVPALTANVPYTFNGLNEGDSLQIETPSDAGFNGTYISATGPIAVFSGHSCSNIPALSYGYCDHLEEQLIGLQSWGRQYVAARMPVRSTGTPEVTVWQVFASQNATTVTFHANAAVTGLPASPQVMNAGQVLQFSVSGNMAHPGDFIVTGDKPIHVMAYLTGSDTCNVSPAQAGDPAMTQMVPVAQYLDNYIVLVPVNWIYDYAILVKPVGSTVNMDGNPVAQGAFIPTGDGLAWEVARISVPDGVHTFTGTAPFGIVIVGYDSYDSYAYPGGLNMQILNPIN